MSANLPTDLTRLLEKHPLFSRADVLEFGACKYAKVAADYGTDGSWWRVWREIQHARGLPMDNAVEELSRQQRRWFALWSFNHHYGEEGRIAYERYLADPGKIGPFEHENAQYLDHLLVMGEYSKVLEVVAHLTHKYDDVPLEQIRAVWAEMALGVEDAALTRAIMIRERHHDDGNLWALTALLYQQRGDTSNAQEALREAAKLGVTDTTIMRHLLHELNVSAEQWNALQAPYEQPSFDYDEQARQWWADPGARPVPTDHVSPHWFGGDTFHMPECWGCGHSIRQWFVFDLRLIQSLHRRLPTRTLFPLLGCVDCMVWMGRHDYEVDLGTRSIKLGNVAISLKEYGQPLSTVPPLQKRYVDLEWVAPKLHPTEEDIDAVGWEHPQIAGTPFWTQNSQRLNCRTCRQEMVFVAAMATTEEFGPEIFINNGSGYQYHFACDRCHTISVLAQWT
jgi:hypothetical protein